MIRLLYESAAGDRSWSDFVEAILRATNSSSGFVIGLGRDQVPALYSQIGLDEESLQTYQRHFYKKDLVLEGFRRQANEHGSWIGTRSSVAPDSLVEKSEFYNDYMIGRGLYHQAGVSLSHVVEFPFSGLSLVRPRTTESFQRRELLLLRMAKPHLRQAFVLHQKLRELQERTSIISKALESSEIVCLSVGSDGIVRGMTLAADALLRAGDGLLQIGGRLRARINLEDRSLQAFLRGACQVGTQKENSGESALPPGGQLFVSRKPPKKPLQIVVTPFRSGKSLLGNCPVALVFVTDPNAKLVPRGRLLTSLYGLTPAEVKLSELLAQGFDVKHVAEQMRVTEASARFVLHRVFRKTYVTSQSGLMKLILSLPAIR